jgi:hypothetical protein
MILKQYDVELELEMKKEHEQQGFLLYRLFTTIQCNAMQCNAMQCNATQRNAMQSWNLQCDTLTSAIP